MKANLQDTKTAPRCVVLIASPTAGVRSQWTQALKDMYTVLDVGERGSLDRSLADLKPDVLLLDLALHRLGHQLGHLVVDGHASGAKKQADSVFGKITLQFFQNRHRRVITVPDAKNQLIVRIILAAETRVVFVCFGVQSPDGLQIADRRQKVGIPRQAGLRAPKKTPRAIQNQQVIDKGRGSDGKK